MKKNLLVLVISALFFLGCKKPEGPGGNAVIKGKVWVEDWNVAFTVKNGEHAGADEDVYIIYGDDLSYGDRVRANFNGEFEFKFLNKGKYRIYVYSRDKTLSSVSGDTYFLKEAEISKKNQTVELEQFIIYK